MYMQRIHSSKAVSTSGRRVAAAPVSGGASAAAARRSVRARSNLGGAAGAEKALFGENFGARDPFAAEIESNFGEKVLGNWNTDHIIKPPDAIGRVIGLSARPVPAAADLALLDDATRERLRQQVPGWRVVTAPGSNGAGAGAASIQQEWTAKDAAAAAEMVAKVQEVAAAAGHAPAAVEAVGNTVVARLSTAALGGLTEADFIVAARVNDLDFKPFLAQRKQRFWA